tara:strand:+ start:4123 stop:4329 length:207 start_codon:yes stop_codon:yes gene_type:complete
MTELEAFDEGTGTYVRIFIDVTNYEPEEHDDHHCIITHKFDTERSFLVRRDYNSLKHLAMGFTMNGLN